MIPWVAGCAAVHVEHGVRSTLPVAPVDDGDRLYVLDDDGRTWFVDTGYQHTTCDDDLAAALALTVRGSVRVQGTSGRTRAGRASLPPLSLGGHRVEGVRCLVRDLATTSSVEPAAVGVVGMDVLEHFRVHVERGEVTLGESGAPIDGAVRLGRTADGGPSAELRLGDHVVHALVDTGASHTCVDAARLPFEVQEVGRVSLRGSGDDGHLEVPTFRVADVTWLAHPAPPLELIALPRRWWAPDLLGMDVLSAFAVTLDFPRRQVAAVPVSSPSRPGP